MIAKGSHGNYGKVSLPTVWCLVGPFIFSTVLLSRSERLAEVHRRTGAAFTSQVFAEEKRYFQDFHKV